MPFLIVWIHYVWSTKNREPLISKAVKTRLYAHIRQNALSKGIHLDSMNGTADHLHAVVALKPDQSIAKIAQLLKGESSHWMNEQKIIRRHFEWQEEYYAASVSEGLLDQLRSYIANQERHHQHKSFPEECQKFMRKLSRDA